MSKKYDVKIMDRIKAHNKAKTKTKTNTRTKWAKFPCVGRQTKFITKLFRNF